MRYKSLVYDFFFKNKKENYQMNQMTVQKTEIAYTFAILQLLTLTC